jgi:hypothetical protein
MEQTMTTLYLTPGDSFVYATTIDDEDGEDFNLAGSTLRFTIKRRVSDANSAAMAALYWISGGASDGITVGTPANGGASIVLTPYQTYPFVQASYVWDLEVEDAADVVRTVDHGVIVVRPRATHLTTTTTPAP